MMGEFAQRLSEAADYAKNLSKNEMLVFLGVQKHGIRISAHGPANSITKDVAYIEIEQCQFNLLINAIAFAAAEVAAPAEVKS